MIRRIAIWVMPVLLFIATWQIWDAIEARRINEVLARAAIPAGSTETGFPRLDDGAARYYAAASVFVAWGDYWTSVQLEPRAPIVDATSAFRDALVNGRRPPEAVLTVVSQQLERGRAVFDLLESASPLSFSRFAPGTEFNYRTSGLRTVDRLAELKTLALALNGEPDAAAKVLFDRVKLSRAFDDRSFSQWLKARAVQDSATDLGAIVGRTTVSEERLADLDRALSESYPADALELTIRGEALWWYQQLRSMWEGQGPQGSIGPLLRPVLRHHAIMRLQTASDALAATRLPWPDRLDAMNRIAERRSIVPELVPFVAAWREVPQVRESTIRMAEGIAAVRCARLVVAIERYRASKNRLPDTIDDVMRESDEIAVDPFTGNALFYKREASGYVVYSVGQDRQDQGGTFVSGLAPWQLRGKVPPIDIGVRVQSLGPASSRLAQP